MRYQLRTNFPNIVYLQVVLVGSSSLLLRGINGITRIRRGAFVYLSLSSAARDFGGCVLASGPIRDYHRYIITRTSQFGGYSRANFRGIIAMQISTYSLTYCVFQCKIFQIRHFYRISRKLHHTYRL